MMVVYIRTSSDDRHPLGRLNVDLSKDLPLPVYQYNGVGSKLHQSWINMIARMVHAPAPKPARQHQ